MNKNEKQGLTKKEALLLLGIVLFANIIHSQLFGSGGPLLDFYLVSDSISTGLKVSLPTSNGYLSFLTPYLVFNALALRNNNSSKN